MENGNQHCKFQNDGILKGSMIKFTPILLKTYCTTISVQQELAKTVSAVANGMREDLRKPTRTWEEKPSFATQRKVTSGEISVEVFLNGDTPGNQHYEMLDDGVPEHEVTSDEKHAKFPGTFDPKTIPGTLYSGKGSREGERFVSKGYPLVTGIKARGFSETVTKLWDTKFYDVALRVMSSIANSLLGEEE